MKTTCPTCTSTHEAPVAFCTGCGQILFEWEADEGQIRARPAAGVPGRTTWFALSGDRIATRADLGNGKLTIVLQGGGSEVIPLLRAFSAAADGREEIG